MKNFFLFFLNLLLIFGFINCKDSYIEKTKQIINKNLKIGDDEKKIINFLESQGWYYSFDDSLHYRFQIKDPKSKLHKFLFIEKEYFIFIYVDQVKTFKNVEVESIFTSL